MDQQTETASSNELVRQLSQKVREQTQKLISLEQYKSLCEARIKQLAPDHPFPVKQQHINENTGKNNSQHQQREMELIGAYKKIEALEKQLELFKKSTSQILLENYDYPHPSSLSDFDISYVIEIYQQLYNEYNQALKEKTSLEQSLRNEALNNEEQRTYIEVLKQALEKSIQESGMGFFIHKYGKDSSDIFAQIANIKQTNEIYELECQKLSQGNQNLMQEIAQLKEQIIILQRENDSFMDNKNETNIELQKAVQALTYAKQEVEKLESEKISLLEYCNESNDKEKQLIQKLSKYEQETSKFQNKEMLIIKEQGTLSSQLTDAQAEMIRKDQLIQELEDLKGQHEIQIMKLEQKNNELQEEVSLNLKQQETSIQKLEKTKYELQQRIQEYAKLEQEFTKMQENNTLIIKEIRKENEILSRQLTEFKKSNEQLQAYLEETKGNLKKTCLLYEAKFEEYQMKFQSEAREKSKLESQFEQIFSSNTILQQSLQQTEQELQNALQDNEALREQNKKLENEYEIIADQKETQQKKLKDISQNQSTQQKQSQQIQKDFTSLKKLKEEEITTLHKQISELEKDNQRLRDQIIEDSDVLRQQIDQLNEKATQQNKELEKIQQEKEKLLQAQKDNQSAYSQTQKSLKEKEQIINELQKENSSLQQMAGQFQQIQNQLQNLENEKSQLVQSYGEVKTQGNFHKEQLQALNEKCKLQSQELSKAKHLQKEKEQELSQLANQTIKLQENQKNQIQKIESLKSKIKQRKQRTNQLKQVNESLKQDLHNISIQYELVCEENKRSASQMKEMQHIQAQAQNACKNYENIMLQIQNLYGQFLSAEQQDLKQLSQTSDLKEFQRIPKFIQNLIQQIQNLKSKLEQSENIVQSHGKQIQLIDSQIDSITEQDRQLLEKNALLEAQFQSLKKEYQQLLLQHQEAIQTQSDYQHELDIAHKELLQVNQLNIQLQDEVDTLHAQITQLEYDLENEKCGTKAVQLQIVIQDRKLKQLQMEKNSIQNLLQKCCSSIESTEIRVKYSDLYQLYQDLNDYQAEKQRLQQSLEDQNNSQQIQNSQQ